MNGKKSALKDKLDELTSAQDILKEKEEDLKGKTKELSDTQVSAFFMLILGYLRVRAPRSS